MKAAACLSLLPLLASASPVFNVGTVHNEAAPVISSVNAKEVPNSYIIKFKSHVKHEDTAAHHSWVQEIHSSNENERTELRKRSQFPITDDIFEGLKHTYNVAGSFLGYSGHFDEDVIELIRRHPDVSTVTCDRPRPDDNPRAPIAPPPSSLCLLLYPVHRTTSSLSRPRDALYASSRHTDELALDRVCREGLRGPHPEGR